MVNTATELLEVKGLHGGYGRIPVLHGIDLAVGSGEIVGVLGHNGMGKSTLLKTIIGLLPAKSGSIRFDGQDIGKLSAHERARRGLGYVPQGRGVFPKLSVRDNLRMAFQEVGGDDENATIERVLDSFPQVRRLIDREGGALSGGEQQLLALARAMMGDPWLLLLDEPTEGIQPSIIEEMEQTLTGLQADRGLSILLVEQNFEFIHALADRVLVLERGRITAEISGADLQQKGRVEEFLGFGAARTTGRMTVARTPPKASPAAATQPAGAPAAAVFDAPLRHPSGERRDPGARLPEAERMPLRPAPPPSRSAVPAGARPATSSTFSPATAKATTMSVKRPTLGQMREMSERLRLSMSDSDLAEYLAVMEPYMEAYDRLAAAPDFLPEVKYPRSPGYRPDASENPLNAWYYKTDIKGAADGPLRGKRIVLKDTVCLAGVPMMNGSSIMEGYVPEIDATIVTRMLDAGATIVGKSHCEYLCLSGGSHTNATGPVHNPYKHGYMAGGSSSGSAVLVATGEVDMAIAGDQGGSIRIPSSNCGTYGMKPTHGLVPYTGVMPVEQTIDHVGPLTANVADNALLLEVLAGEDGLDPRQYKPRTYRYTEALGKGVQGLRIGILREGFGRPESEADVDEKVRAAAERYRELGARVEEISIPDHLLVPDYWTAITVEGLQDMMMHGNTSGTNHRGLFLPSMVDHFANWENRADELSSSLKTCMFLGEYFQTRYRGRFYGKAQNLMRRATLRYKEAFRAYDLLLLPTLPMKAQEIPPPDAALALYVQRAFEMVGNTAPFNSSGFPAMSLPCGMSEGLPVGMMLVGKNYDEMTIYRAAHAFEQLGDWRAM
ncbi:amidase [Oceanibacterium hippocampi]|uniref:amidase n=1 Tax=Oceanibacterium hippocampi TaxID=745714 RepID=UPI000A26D30C